MTITIFRCRLETNPRPAYLALWVFRIRRPNWIQRCTTFRSPSRFQSEGFLVSSAYFKVWSSKIEIFKSKPQTRSAKQDLHHASHLNPCPPQFLLHESCWQRIYKCAASSDSLEVTWRYQKHRGLKFEPKTAKANEKRNHFEHPTGFTNAFRLKKKFRFKVYAGGFPTQIARDSRVKRGIEEFPDFKRLPDRNHSASSRAAGLFLKNH